MTAFLDTNVLVYVYDAGDRPKQDRALSLIASLPHEEIAISAQVVSEFHTAVQRLSVGLDEPTAVAATRSLLALRVIGIDSSLIDRALEIRERWQPSYWDALIVAAAERSGADLLYSEDFSHDQQIAGVRIVNPFL